MTSKNICTVLLITYNHAKYVRTAIESVLCQKTQYPFVIKIFDDASTDGSSDIIREYAKKYPNKIEVYISEKNQGAQTNIWNAYKSVDTKYCCLLETDDCWCDKNKLQLQINALENNPDCSFCMHQSLIKNIHDDYRPNEDGQFLIKNKKVLDSHKISLGDILNQEVGSGYIGSATSRLIRSECLDINNIKNKEAILFDNAQFYWLLLKGNCLFINKVMTVYNQTGCGTFSGQHPIKRIRDYISAFEEFNTETKDIIALRIYKEISVFILYYIGLVETYNKNIKNKNAFKDIEHYFIPPCIRDIFKPKTYIKIYKIIQKGCNKIFCNKRGW